MTVTFTQQPRIVSQTSSSVTVDAVVESEAAFNPLAFVMEVEVGFDDSFTMAVNGSDDDYDCTVDWGDGTSDTIATAADPAWTHDYSVGGAGTYIIQITGTLKQVGFWESVDKLKVTRLLNIGDVGLLNMLRMFLGCSNFVEASSHHSVFGKDTNVALNDAFGNTFLNGGVFNLAKSNLVSATTVNMFRSCKPDSMDLSFFDGIELTLPIYMFQNGFTLPAPLDVSNFDVSAATDVNAMFDGINAEVVGLDQWDIGALTTALSFHRSRALPTATYDATLIAWAAQPHQNDVPIDFGTSIRTGASDAAFNGLIADGWTITDGNGTSP